MALQGRFRHNGLTRATLAAWRGIPVLRLPCVQGKARPGRHQRRHARVAQEGHAKLVRTQKQGIHRDLRQQCGRVYPAFALLAQGHAQRMKKSSQLRKANAAQHCLGKRGIAIVQQGAAVEQVGTAIACHAQFFERLCATLQYQHLIARLGSGNGSRNARCPPADDRRGHAHPSYAGIIADASAAGNAFCIGGAWLRL